MKVVGSQDMLSFGQYVFAIMSDPRCRPEMNTLLDCTEATVHAPTETDNEQQQYHRFVDELSKDDADPRRKVAVVAGDNLAAFGVSRMREVPLSDSSIQMMVFHHSDEALPWLGLPPDIVQELEATEPLN